jgi:hypothetical protein
VNEVQDTVSKRLLRWGRKVEARAVDPSEISVPSLTPLCINNGQTCPPAAAGEPSTETGSKISIELERRSYT